jgi:hypothetical protein
MVGGEADFPAGGLPYAELSAVLPVEILADAVAPLDAQGGKQTAKKAIAILLAKNQGFHEPTGKERDALLVGFAMRRKVIYGAAFDAVRISRPVDLREPAQIAANMDAIELFEVKSTNRTVIGPDFGGYFFALSTAELLVAQSLREQFRFAFVNTLTGDHLEMSLREVFARARGIYPTWSIRF